MSTFGKLLLISECGRYISIEAKHYKPGTLRTDRQGNVSSALTEALNGQARFTTGCDRSYFVGVPVGSLLERQPEMFNELLQAYEKMQRSDLVEDRIEHQGTLKVARMVWASSLNSKSKIAAEIKMTKQESDSNAVKKLFNPDID